MGKLGFHLYFYGLNIVMNWCALNVLIAIICSAFDESVECSKQSVKKVFDPWCSIWGGGWKSRHELGEIVHDMHDAGKEVAVVSDILTTLKKSDRVLSRVVDNFAKSLLLDHVNTTRAEDAIVDEKDLVKDFVNEKDIQQR